MKLIELTLYKLCKSANNFLLAFPWKSLKSAADDSQHAAELNVIWFTICYNVAPVLSYNGNFSIKSTTLTRHDSLLFDASEKIQSLNSVSAANSQPFNEWNMRRLCIINEHYYDKLHNVVCPISPTVISFQLVIRAIMGNLKCFMQI